MTLLVFLTVVVVLWIGWSLVRGRRRRVLEQTVSDRWLADNGYSKEGDRRWQ
jgi:hypothetical protein